MRKLKDLGVEFQKAKLSNGIPVFLFKRKGMPINIKAVFFAGSRFDEIPGTAHFLEHMLVAGTKKFPSKNLLADHIQKVGGDFGAVTNQDTIKIWLEIPEPSDLDIGIELLSECLTKSLFDKETIEKERGAILSELGGKKSSPSAYVQEISRKITFQDTSIENGNLGSEEDINLIKKEDLLNHYNKFINTGRTVFVVSGDVEMDDLVKKLNLIELSPGEFFQTSGELPIYNEKKLITERYPKASQSHIVFSCRTSIKDYKEFCALMLINNILASGRGSRLMTRLRYENGLVYSINGSVTRGQDWGRFSISFSCDKEDYDKATDLIFNEFEYLKKNNISEEELKNFKSRVAKGVIRAMQTSESWTSSHENSCLFESQEVKTIEDYLKTIEELTLEDIKEVINQYLDKANFYTAICGDWG